MIQERYPDALESLEAAVTARPRYTAAWCNRAVVLERMGRPDDALESYDRAIQRDPRSVVLWHNKGILLMGTLGRADEAAACFREEIKLDSRRWFELTPEIRRLVRPTES